MKLNEIIDKAYSLYMPQLKNEITSLANFVYEQNPEIIVEIGTKFGGTFMIWNEISNGLKISIDLPNGIHGGVSLENTTKRNDLFKELYGDKCIFIEGDSHHQSTYNHLIEILKDRQIDFMFIDGDHTYDGVKQDFEMYSKLVKKGGYIAFHDINDTQKHRDREVYVCKLWNELKGEKIEFNDYADWGGIGVIKI